MKRVAIVYHYLALYRLPVFLELMRSEEIEYTIFSGDTSEINIKKIDDSLSSINISQGGLRWKFLKNRWLFNKNFLWQSGLIKVALFGKYDSYIFLGSPYHLSTWLAVIIVRCRGIRTYYWMHGVYKDKIGFIDQIKLKLFYKLPSGFFLYGNRSLSILKKYKTKPNEDMHVIYNSLDYNASLKKRRLINKKEVTEYRIKYFNDEFSPVVVFIGRLNYIKRIDMLIKAREVLKKEDKNTLFNILIIGDGEERTRLEQQVKELGLSENVKFLGAVYDESINSEALMLADLCVTPGEVGLTAIHAMSYGTPVISHDNLNLQMPEVEAILIGVTGDLYMYKNVEDLAKKIDNWLERNPSKTSDITNSCFAVIDAYYNPKIQRKVIENAILNKKL